MQRSLADFEARRARDTGARLVPWLQDFSLGVTYGPAQVRAQIAAARRDGVDEFLLWDPDVTYDDTGPRAERAPRGSRRRGTGTLQLPVTLRVHLAPAEDLQTERHGDHPYREQWPDVGPERAGAKPSMIAWRIPLRAYVAGEIFASHCIHDGSTATG